MATGSGPEERGKRTLVRRIAALAALACAVAGAAAVAQQPTGDVLFTGDFDSCDLSQWPERQDGGPDDIAAVRFPRSEPASRCSGYFSTGPGDGIGGTSPRNELWRQRDEVCCNEGDTRWFRWSVRLKRDWLYGDSDEFSTIMQFKSNDSSPGQMSFVLFGDELRLNRGRERWSTRMTRGRWHDFLLNVKFSQDSSRGRVRLWYDGRRQTVNGGRPFATLANGNGAYVKLGLYRSGDLPRAALHHDEFRIGRTRASVER